MDVGLEKTSWKVISSSTSHFSTTNKNKEPEDLGKIALHRMEFSESMSYCTGGKIGVRAEERSKVEYDDGLRAVILEDAQRLQRCNINWT